MKNTIGLLMLSIILFSCNGFYKVLTVKNPAPVDCIRTLDMKNRYFILHSDSTVFAMENISLSDNNNKIQCSLVNLPEMHTLYTGNSNPKKLKYLTGGDEYNGSVILKEVHLYLSPGNTLTAGQNKIAIANVNTIEVLEKDKQKTRRHRVVGWFLCAGSAAVVVALIAAASLSKMTL
jgi:hypothetical protein